MTLSNIITQLSSIHLEESSKCINCVRQLVDSVFPLTWLHHPLKVGTIISRCRKDAPDFERESFGCKSPDLITKFQRASIPYESVFYGSVGDQEAEDGDFIAMLETSTLHRKKIIKGIEEIAVSRWRVKRDIPMAIICHPKVFVDANQNSSVNAMQKNYVRCLPKYPAEEDFIPLFDRLVEFVAGQFAKKVLEGNNHQYMISAFFAHNSLSTDSGIIYPSVQVNGKLGFNVALRQDIVENYLEFIGAEKHILYKANKYLQFPANKYPDKYIAECLNIYDLHFLPTIN